MEQKPSKELVERAELFAAAVMARKKLLDYAEEQGYEEEEDVPKSFQAAVGLVNGLTKSLCTDDVLDVFKIEGVQVLTEVTDMNGDLLGVADL